jgi:DNA-binding SARP family transcriptional activator/tetratricopeptide (TPR) repeat protein
VRTEFCLLGPLTVRHSGTAVAITHGKQRSVLASLLLSAGHVVSHGEIAEAVWGFGAPPSADVSIRNYVRRLRQTLQDAGLDRILTRPGGYLIRVDADELDLVRFERLAADAQAAMRAGAWETAGVHATAALALWSGEALAGVPSEALAAREVPRLTELRLQALETRIGAEIRLGRPSDVIGELRRLIAVQPFREPLRALLMLALHESGRQADALAAYQHARQALVEELGTEPGAELRDLHQRLLEGSRETRPVVKATAENGESRLVPTAARDNGRSRQRLGDTGTGPVPRQLPAANPHFVGRDAEISAFRRLVDDACPVPGAADSPPDVMPGAIPIVIITGTAGVGKTALALRLAHLVANRFADGQLYLDLRGFDPTLDPLPTGAAIRSFLDALHVPSDQIPAGLDAQAGLYRSLLAGRRMLIVLDNAASAGQIRSLLPGGGRCLVLVTSRRQLTPLAATDGARILTLDVLTAIEAHDLLATRLGETRVAADPAATAELFAECAGLPIALSIVAARAESRPAFPLAAVASELRDARRRLDALDGGEASTDVRAIFSWSYEQLPAADAAMFRMLGLHPGPDITEPAVASMAGISRRQAGRVLRRLAANGLLAEHIPGRFAFHDLLHLYAAEKALATDSEETRRVATSRAVDHYLHSARAADHAIHTARPRIAVPAPLPGTDPETFGGHEEALAWFDQEYHVLLAVISLAAAHGLDAQASHLAWAMESFFHRRAHWRDWASTQEVALAAAERTGDRDGQARAHRGIGNAYIEIGAHDTASPHLARALRLSEDSADVVGQARIHLDMARSAGLRGEYTEYLTHAQLGLDLARSTNDVWGEGNGLAEVAWALTMLGSHREAITYGHASLRILRRTGHQPMQGHVWDTLGHAHRHLGDYRRAAACYRRAVEILDQYGYRHLKAVTLTSAGVAYRAAGDVQAAGDAWREALAILEETHHPDTERVRAHLRDLDLPADVTPAGRQPGLRTSQTGAD